MKITFAANGQAHFRFWAVTASTATLTLPEHGQLSTDVFHLDKRRKHVPRAGEVLPLPRPRRWRNRPPEAQGNISLISKHRLLGSMVDGRRSTLQYFVHWQGVPVAYGEWSDARQMCSLPQADRHIADYLRSVRVSDP